MSIFEHDELREWEGFSDLNIKTMRLRGASGELDALQALFNSVPEALMEQAQTFIVEHSINSLSPKILAFAKSIGAFDLPQVQSSLEVPVRIRDAMFTRRNAAESGHMEILKALALQHGEAFAIDSMSAALDGEFAKTRTGAKGFAGGAEKAESYKANLELLTQFIDERWLSEPSMGNAALHRLNEESFNINAKDGFDDLLKQVSKFNPNDLLLLAHIIKDKTQERGALFAKQIDAAMRQDFRLLLAKSQEHNLFKVLKARPMNTLASLISMTERDMAGFISGNGLSMYADGDWIDSKDVKALEDQNLVDLITLFNQRLSSSPFFEVAFNRNENLKKPNSPGIPFMLLAPIISDKRIYLDLVDSTKSVDAFAGALTSMSSNPKLKEFVDAGVGILDKQMDFRLRKLYKSISEDEDLGKRVKSQEDVDPEYQKRFAAVRLCAELHQQQPKTVAEEKKLTPISLLVGKVHDSIKHKNGLLALVKTYDEATILDALAHYKPGFKPMIELGVLSRKHLDKLPLKDRGAFLEQDMGL